jgi:hypothetical protein
MAGGEEIVGDIAQGALIARVAEPGHGEGGEGQAEAACLNCGAVLSGRFCSACGQAATVHRTLGAFFHDLLHGVLHFEGKIWRTLPLLALNPGRLTREYIDGRRASYVSPIALFLFVVFLTFALFSQLSGPTDWDTVDGKGVKIGVGPDRTELQRQISVLTERIDAARKQGQPTADLDKSLEDTRNALSMFDRFGSTELPKEIAKSDSAEDSDAVDQVNAIWRKVSQNPSLALYKLQTNAYKYSWLLIPISLPFLWLLFPFSRRFQLYDHIVFITYSLSFMMLLLAVGALADQWAWTSWIGVVALIAAPLHLFSQMRGTYGLSRRGALLRLPLLLTFALVALLLWGGALLTLVLTG